MRTFKHSLKTFLMYTVYLKTLLTFLKTSQTNHQINTICLNLWTTLSVDAIIIVALLQIQSSTDARGHLWGQKKQHQKIVIKMFSINLKEIKSDLYQNNGNVNIHWNLVIKAVRDPHSADSFHYCHVASWHCQKKID